MHRFKSAIWPKAFFCSIMKMATKKISMFQGPPNPGLMQEKVQKGVFLMKPSRELIFVCFRFLKIPQRPGMLNQKRSFFWPSKTCTGSVTYIIARITHLSALQCSRPNMQYLLLAGKTRSKHLKYEYPKLWNKNRKH